VSKVILLDVEGTTTPISFVYDVLFPYARKRLDGYVREHYPAGEAKELILKAHAAMDEDKKLGWLKELQGRIWQDGYEKGELQGDVFPDVPEVLQSWAEQGVATSIYSSGSVLAQQLLFRHSVAGDLTPWLHAHFDTAVGAKQEPASYAKIAEQLGSPGIFATDILKEAEAAHAAGWEAVMVDRPGNHPQPPHSFRVEPDLRRLAWHT
jgi:enolase-phosphatase E1